MPDAPAAARAIVEQAIAARVFPAAAVDVGSSKGPLWTEAFGTLTFDERAQRTTSTTPFDLASLTKVIATTTLLMDLVDTGAVRLSDVLSGFFPDWLGGDRVGVTVQDLLEHASGLAPRLRGARPRDRAAFVQDICHIPLDYVPRSRAVYSDLGFILLGFLAADVRGVSLREIVDAVLQRVRQPDETLTFAPPPLLGRRAAPTKPLDDDPRRRDLLVGDVQDDYASALGGVAGHAGLFGTARAVGDFARVVLGARRGVPGPPPFSTTRVAEFATRSTVPGSSRALGWDTMLPTSSCGTLMTDSAIGHVGFTGTSLWIDPGRDRYFVLLSNRTCGGGSLEQMRRVRRAFHDALGAF